MDLQSLALRIKRSENLPVLSEVAGSVLRLADDPRTSARDLERTIERDMALASKILKVANSSYYGQSNVSSISRAVSVLGINTVRSLVVSLAYQQMISNKVCSTRFKKADFWSHSLGVGITTRVICKMMLPQRADEMYLAGLMHDVGFLVLDRLLPAELDMIVKKSENEGIPLHEAEREILGYDHAEVAGILSEQWGLAAAIRNAVRFHHNVGADTETPQTTAIVAIANGLAHDTGLGAHSPVKTPLDPAAVAVIGITEEQLAVIGTVMAQEVAKAQQAFNIQAEAA